MAQYTQENLVTLAKNIKEIDDQRKDLVATIKEFKEEFAKEYDIKKRSLNISLKEFYAFQKDRAKWLEEVNETELLIDMMTGEKCQ